MKKLLQTVLALTLLLALAGCGGGGKGYQTGDVQAMAKAGAFSEELEELDGEVAFALYGLEDCGLKPEELTDCAVLRSAGATCEEAAVLVLAGEDQAETAEGALKDYVQKQIEANTDYRPAEIPKLENALISRKENTLLLVVADDLDAAKKAVE